MIMRLAIITIIILSLTFITGCTEILPNHNIGIGDDDMIEAKIEMLVERFLKGELSEEEIGEMDIDIAREVVDRAIYRAFGPPTEEQREEQRLRAEEHRRVNVEHIIRGDFTPAADDVDLQTIERFVFSDNINDGGYSFVLDRIHGGVHYDPGAAGVHSNLDFAIFSANFIEEDLNRLIQAIEESGLRDWQEHYQGRRDEGSTGSRSWRLGILFSDGTMLRRSGSGEFDDGFPPLDQWTILTDFIKTIGAEIEERHNAEAAQGE